MQVRSLRPFWFVLLMLLGTVGVARSGIADDRAKAAALTQIELSLDRPIDATVAPIVLATTRGLFRAEGLNVTTTAASDTSDAIARVAVGTSQLGLADINALIRFRDEPGAPPVKAVFVLFDKAGYAFIARKSRGIDTLADVEGKTIGVTDGDLSIRLWPALARRNKLPLKTVKLAQVGPAVREPMLSAGQRLTVKAPEQAVDDVLAQMDSGSRAVELERLNAVLSDNILTSEVKHSGIGAIDPVRFETSLDQIAEDFKFRHRPTAADIFDDSFLPPAGDRKITQAE
jgi:ABC-type nitrate/sulfonate/bicarbonate transport system substrate-binding protein